MKSKNPCPFCQTDVIEIVSSDAPVIKGVQIQCDNCGSRGPVYPTKKEAIDGWNLGINGLNGRMK